MVWPLQQLTCTISCVYSKYKKSRNTPKMKRGYIQSVNLITHEFSNAVLRMLKEVFLWRIFIFQNFKIFSESAFFGDLIT